MNNSFIILIIGLLFAVAAVVAGAFSKVEISASAYKEVLLIRDSGDSIVGKLIDEAMLDDLITTHEFDDIKSVNEDIVRTSAKKKLKKTTRAL